MTNGLISVSGMMCSTWSVNVPVVSGPALVYCATLLGSIAADVDVEARAGTNDVSDEESDGERDGRDNLEVEQRLAADASELLQIAHVRDADRDGAEDDRCDDHLDDADEGIPERPHRLAGFGPQETDNHAGDGRNQHLHVEKLEQAEGSHGRLPGT